MLRMILFVILNSKQQHMVMPLQPATKVAPTKITRKIGIEVFKYIPKHITAIRVKVTPIIKVILWFLGLVRGGGGREPEDGIMEW